MNEKKNRGFNLRVALNGFVFELAIGSLSFAIEINNFATI